MLNNSRYRIVLGAALLAAITSCTSLGPGAPEDSRWLVYPSTSGPGQGKRIVLVAGDEEYRSEEAMPMLGRLLSKQHGFETVVLFSQDPDTGLIDPTNPSNIPGLALVAEADLLVLDLRFRELADKDMAYIMDHVNSGKPLIGIRTATHAFNYKENKNSPFAKWSWSSSNPSGGFGRQIFGETWVAHHGRHGEEATRGIPNRELADHPVLNGVRNVFGPTDVYAIRNLPEDATILMYGAVLDGMHPEADPLPGSKNSPMHPVAWLRERKQYEKRSQRIFVTTMGAATDFSSEDLRRLFLNAAFWTLNMEKQIPQGGLEASMLGPWNPTDFGFGGYRTGMRPEDYRNGTPE